MRTDALGCIATALGRLASIVAICLTALPAGANNTRRRLVHGALVAAHRGSRGADARRARAHLRNLRDRPADRDLHLRRLGSVTGSRCGPHHAAEPDRRRHLLQLAGGPAIGRPGLHRRRRQLDRYFDHQHRQSRQQRIQLRQQHADEGERHEPRALVFVLDHAAERRDLHPGRRGRHRPAGNPGHRRRVPPAVRRQHQRIRFHVPAQLHRAGWPRIRIRQLRTHVLRQYFRHRPGDDGRPVQRADRQRREHRDVPTRQDPAIRRQFAQFARHRHHQRRAGRDPDAAGFDAAAPGQRDHPGRRPGARDRRQPRMERDDRRQLQRRDLEPDDRAMAARPARGARPPLSLDGGADAGCERAGGRRRRAGSPGQHEHRGLLPLLPLQRGWRFRDAPGDRGGAGHGRHRRNLRRGDGWQRRHQPRRDDQDGLGHAQLEHGTAIRRADLPAERQQPARAGTDARRRRAARFLHAVRLQCRRHAGNRAHPARRRRREPQSRDHAEPGQPGQPDGRCRHGDEPSALRHGPERRYAHV